MEIMEKPPSPTLPGGITPYPAKLPACLPTVDANETVRIKHQGWPDSSKQASNEEQLHLQPAC